MPATVLENRPRPVLKEGLLIEQVFAIVEAAVNGADRDFYKQHLRYPNLKVADDIILLANFINPIDFAEKLPGISRYEIGNTLLRHFIERSELFAAVPKRTEFLQALVGRVFYNPSPREYWWRSDQLRNASSAGAARLPNLGEDLQICLDTCSKVRQAANKALDLEPALHSSFKDSLHNPCARVETNISQALKVESDAYTIMGKLIVHQENSAQYYHRFFPSREPHYR